AAGIPERVCFWVLKNRAPPSTPKDHLKRSSRKAATSLDLLDERASWALSAVCPMVVRARMERAAVEMRMLPPNERTKRADGAGELEGRHTRPVGKTMANPVLRGCTRVRNCALPGEQSALGCRLSAISLSVNDMARMGR